MSGGKLIAQSYAQDVIAYGVCIRGFLRRTL